MILAVLYLIRGEGGPTKASNHESKNEKGQGTKKQQTLKKGEGRPTFAQPALTIIDSTTPEAHPTSVYVKSPITKPMIHPTACQVMGKAR